MENLFAAAILIALIWGAVSIPAIVYPFRPFRTRKRAVRSLGAAAAAIVAAFIGFGVSYEVSKTGKPEAETASVSPAEALEPAAAAGSGNEKTEVEIAAVRAPVDRPLPRGAGREAGGERIVGASTSEAAVDAGLGEPPRVCTFETAASDRLLTAGPAVLLRTGPEPQAPGVVNERATQVLGSTQHYELYGSQELFEVCRQADAVLVEVAWPEIQRGLRGWVGAADVRPIEVTAAGNRILTEADVYWEEDTARHKPAIVAALNRIQAENDRCHRADPGAVALSQDSTPGDPLFFVNCTTEDGDSFNVHFRLGDESFAAVRAIDAGDAASACERAAKVAAAHPSTVSFSYFLDLIFQDFPDGRAVVRSTFTARNAFNLELKYRINCFFEGSKLADVEIFEAL